MAKKNITPTRKKVNNAPRGKLWRELKPGTKRKYKAAGVTPAKYNAARGKRGAERADYLGLPRHKISGPSTAGGLSKAEAVIYSVFGSAPRYKAEGVRHFLKQLPPVRIRKIASASKQEVYDWAFNGDDEHTDDYSGGYLFYH